MYIENPKTKGSGIIGAIPQKGKCPINCEFCFFNERSYLAPLEVNTPNMPSQEEAEGKVVRVNDGGDSSTDFPLSVTAAKIYKDKFYNTSSPSHLLAYDAPIVLTVNPGLLTNEDIWLIPPIESKKIMFVRFRLTSWNVLLAKRCIMYYQILEIPTVLTPMAYPSILPIPNSELQFYEWKKRTLNDYWVLTKQGKDLVKRYLHGETYFWCEGECRKCGNCLREYFRKKEELWKLE
jgi:hypothetical protein